MKRPLSRSQRGSTGIKGKQILQICVLLGILIWLIYQVKYSHEKKKKESVLLSESEDRLVKLGRKDLLPGYNNHKENVEEEDEDEEEDKIAGDTDKDEDYFEEEIDMSIDEAREVHYNVDDASSAVSHESRILNIEKLKESSKNLNETAQENNNNVVEVETRKEPILKDSDSKSANSTEALRFSKNETEIMLDRNQEDDATPPVWGLSDLKTVLKLEKTTNESDPNITVSANITNKDSIQDESKNSTSLLEKNSGSNSTEVKENSRFEDDDESSEKESSNLFSTEGTEEADDSSKHSISEEEMEAFTDPQTDIRIEDKVSEEEAIAAERKKL